MSAQASFSALNECTPCRLKQPCCRQLQDLMLSHTEYRAHFAMHAHKFSVQCNGQWYLLSAMKGQQCPYLQNGLCNIYMERPLDCRLYPLAIHLIDVRDGEAVIAFHSRTQCPCKSELIPPTEEAYTLITLFSRSVFGPEVRVTVIRETMSLWLLRRAGFTMHWWVTLRRFCKLF